MTIQTEQIGLRLKIPLIKKFRAYCEREGRSQTWVVDKALSNYLQVRPFDHKKEVQVILAPAEKKKPAAKQVAVVDNDAADYVIDRLNELAGTKYRHTATNRKLINARLKDYSMTDVGIVVKKKCLEWQGGEMARYLRPSTLFNDTKFEEYLNQNISEDSANGQNRPKSNIKETPLERMARKQKSMDMRSAPPEHYGQVVGENDAVVSTQMGIDGRGSLE
jgi:uncharacterized phage protein (TIGR02220 family)